MRLFIGILLEEPLLNALCGATQYLKDHSYSGNFTRKENLHLTLAFIGETEQVSDVIHAMDQVTQSSFFLTLQGTGSFSICNRDLYWAGVVREAGLSAVHVQLYNALRTEGFIWEDRPYQPHLTLGRKVMIKDSFDWEAFSASLPSVQTKIEKISLISSALMQGKRVYTEIHSKILKI